MQVHQSQLQLLIWPSLVLIQLEREHEGMGYADHPQPAAAVPPASTPFPHRPFPLLRREPWGAEEAACWDSSIPLPNVFSGILGVGRGWQEHPWSSVWEGRKQRCSCRQWALGWSTAARHGCTGGSLGTWRKFVQLRAAGLSLPSTPPS